MVDGMVNKNGRIYLRREPDTRQGRNRRELVKEISHKHPSTTSEFEAGGFYSSLVVWGLKILQIGGGRSLCAFMIPDHLTNEEGNWTAGANAAMIDINGASSINPAVGEIKLKKLRSKGKVLFDVDKLTHVLMEIKKKSSGALVAVGRQWMSSISTTTTTRSKS